MMDSHVPIQEHDECHPDSMFVIRCTMIWLPPNKMSLLFFMVGLETLGQK